MSHLSHREFFADLGKRLSSSTYGAVASYVAGYDAGTEHAALFGFDEWLAMRSGHAGRAWITVIPEVAFDGLEPPKPYSATEDQLVVTKLFELIDQFLAEAGPLTARRELLRKFTAWEAQRK